MYRICLVGTVSAPDQPGQYVAESMMDGWCLVIYAWWKARIVQCDHFRTCVKPASAEERLNFSARTCDGLVDSGCHMELTIKGET